MVKEYEILKSTYEADIDLCKFNPNTPADIVIYYKAVYIWICKAGGDNYYLEIYLKNQLVLLDDVPWKSHPWETVIRELDKYLPVKKDIPLF